MKNKKKTGGTAPKTKQQPTRIDQERISKSPEILKLTESDKVDAALHEASHVFVGDAIGMTADHVFLRRNPNGGVMEKYWVGSTAFPGFLDLNSFAAMGEIRPEAWQKIVKFESFKQRMVTLAGPVGEMMHDAIKFGKSLSCSEAVDLLKLDWESHSPSDKRPFEDDADAISEKEVDSLMRLLEAGWNTVMQIADELINREMLKRDDLDEIPSLRVGIPESSDLADFDSWKLFRV